MDTKVRPADSRGVYIGLRKVDRSGKIRVSKYAWGVEVNRDFFIGKNVCIFEDRADFNKLHIQIPNKPIFGQAFRGTLLFGDGEQHLQIVLRITFEDHGQDFRYWDVEPKSGKVLEARPFQGPTWTKMQVLNSETLVVGDLLSYQLQPLKKRQDKRLAPATFSIKYPIKSIELVQLPPQDSDS